MASEANWLKFHVTLQGTKLMLQRISDSQIPQSLSQKVMTLSKSLFSPSKQKKILPNLINTPDNSKEEESGDKGELLNSTKDSRTLESDDKKESVSSPSIDFGPILKKTARDLLLGHLISKISERRRIYSNDSKVFGSTDLSITADGKVKVTELNGKSFAAMKTSPARIVHSASYSYINTLDSLTLIDPSQNQLQNASNELTDSCSPIKQMCNNESEVLQLDYMSRVNIEPNNRKKFVFRVIVGIHRSFLLRAASNDEMEQWINYLRHAINSA